MTTMNEMPRVITGKNNYELVRNHLIHHSCITPVEALIVHGVQRLASRIHELRKDGWSITTERCKDAHGRRYFRYWYQGAFTGTPAEEYIVACRRTGRPIGG